MRNYRILFIKLQIHLKVEFTINHYICLKLINYIFSILILTMEITDSWQAFPDFSIGSKDLSSALYTLGASTFSSESES